MGDRNQIEWLSRLWARLTHFLAGRDRQWVTLSIGNKLFLGFGTVTLILIITVIVSLFVVRDIRIFTDRMMDHHIPTVSNNAVITRDVYASLAALHGWVVTGQQSYKVERKAIWHQLNKLVQSTDRLSMHWKKHQQVANWEKAKAYIFRLRRIQDKVEAFTNKSTLSINTNFLATYPIIYINEVQSSLTRLHRSVKNTHLKNQKETLKLTKEVQKKTAIATSFLQKYLVSGNLGQRKAFEKHWAESSALFSLLWKMKSKLPSFQVQSLEYIGMLRAESLSVTQKLIKLRQTKAWNPSMYLLLAQAEPEASKILDILIGSKNTSGERLGGLQGEQYFSLIANTYGLSIDITRLQWFEWVMLLLGTLISLVVAIITTCVICRPLRQAISIAGSIAAGKRDLKIKPHSTHDEAGKLLNALAHMQASIRKAESTLEARKEEMRYMAFHDTLTELPNRHQFQNDIERLLQLAQRHKRRFGLLLIDLDDFKVVNDTLGHDVGDNVLIAIAERLKKSLRKTDFVARLSGDEFAVLLYDIVSDHVAGRVADKIIKSIREPIHVKSYQVDITASIGIACYPSAGDSIEAIRKHADIAMYRAKQKGRNRFQYFNALISERHEKRLSIENNIGHAIEHEEFSLVYQPVFELSTQKIVGLEALLRWNHSELGVIKPEYFLPIADEMGAMRLIDQWVFRHACEQYKKWLSEGIGPLNLSINLSSTHENYSALFQGILDELDIPKNKIYLELTERVLMDNIPGFETTLMCLHDSGLKIAIDDFGKGSSSLSQLNQLPVSVLKIDRTFVEGVGATSANEGIIKSIITLGKSLNLEVVAEGIETKKQLEFLIDQGCEFGQGFYCAKPLSPEEVSEKFK